MAGVTAALAFTLSARLTGAAVGGQVPQFNAEIDRALDYEPGTAALNETNVLYKATRQIAASGNEDLDLAGVLANALGATVAAAEAVLIVIEADEGNVNDVVYGPAASGGALLGFGDASDRRKVAPGDFEVLSCRRGWPVAGGSADKLNVANGGAGSVVNYTITVIGRTVAA